MHRGEKMKQAKIRLFPYLLSVVIFILFIIFSASMNYSTQNTVWGMFGFLLFCIPGMIGSVMNARICLKKKSGLRFLFYILTFYFSAWTLGSVIVIIVALLNGFLPLV